MPVDVLLGLQWGDEGKGKIVDVLAPRYDLVARFQGGPNAGHSLEFNGQKHVLHTIPSGIFQEGKLNLIGNGVVIDPIVLWGEIEKIEKNGTDLSRRLVISKKAHLILPTHRLLDAASEASKGSNKIGSTLKGIGPAYMDKTGRNGLRMGDILHPNFKERYHFLCSKHKGILETYAFKYELEVMEKQWFESIEFLKRFEFVDSEYLVNNYLKNGKTILAEGAQGSLLDIDFGSYPFVTSSNTVTAGACTGLGIPPSSIRKVYGIFKAYSTRVGGGPFPTELNDPTGETMRQKGKEFGSTTGRPRRCGWLDLPALKYSIMVNGVTELLMMKADVLSGFPEVKIATGYTIHGKDFDMVPFDPVSDFPIPVLKTFRGWTEDLTGLKNADQLPENLHTYIRFIEAETEVPVSVVSVGPDRSQTLHRS